MRLAIIGVLAFVLGAAGATGAVLLQSSADARTPGGAGAAASVGTPTAPPPEAAPGVEGEGAGPAVEGGAGGVEEEVRAADLQPMPEPAESQGTVGSAAIPAGGPPMGGSATGGGSGSPTTAPVEAEGAPSPDAVRRMARIFAAMKPQEAAAVLGHMPDEEVRLVLLQIAERQAAQILGAFDPDRAAELTRIVLGSRRAP